MSLGRTLVLAALAAVATSACAREAPPPAQRRRPDINLRLETVTIEARVPRRATLDTLLREQQLLAPIVDAAVTAARSVFDLRRLRTDRPYRLVRSLDGFLREFEYEIDADRFLRLVARNHLQPGVIDAEVVPYDTQTEVVSVQGRIDADHPSVIAAMDETGETVQLAMSLAEIFGGQIDFESDLQQGDRFEVLVEKSSHDGEFSGYGAILGARFVTDGRDLRAVRWSDPSTGRADYYDENGRSLKRFFLRTPLRFEPRVTSGFSRNRLHPVFRTYRAHLGIDYAAPTGAPVVAAAGGTVVSAGWSGGGGNMVHLRHPSGFETYYLHLSAIGKGMRVGAHVEQGQFIGRVGATGTATGPHLDYRLKKNGVFVNPLAEHRKLPPGEPIPAAQLAAFRAQLDDMLRAMETPIAGAPPNKPDAITATRSTAGR
jgi:murein DD-endopeptidase MepM/ murein hydrolase activator NlpD